VDYKDHIYHRLPPNARKAVDRVMSKRKHTDFYLALSRLNENIRVYRSVFYDRVPRNEAHYRSRKQAQKKDMKDVKEKQVDQKFERRIMRKATFRKLKLDLKDRGRRSQFLLQNAIGPRASVASGTGGERSASTKHQASPLV
jgi:hypothetical protein